MRTNVTLLSIIAAAALMAPLSVQSQRVVTEMEDLVVIGHRDLEAGSVIGTVVLQRRPSNNTFSWVLKASGLEPGNAYTVWVGNFMDEEGNFLITDAGYGAGGLVGGDGQIRAAGNQCLWELETFNTGGFQPGMPPICDLVKLKDRVWFIVFDHGKWEPGDILEFWTPEGDDGGNIGNMGAFFGALE